MAAATVTELRNMLGGLAGMSDAVVQQYLDDAAVEVDLGGVESTETAFALLQKYFAASLIETKGGEGGPISSESVDDVSTSYGRSGSSQSESWMGKYSTLRIKVLGMEHIIA